MDAQNKPTTSHPLQPQKILPSEATGAGGENGVVILGVTGGLDEPFCLDSLRFALSWYISLFKRELWFFEIQKCGWERRVSGLPIFVVEGRDGEPVAEVSVVINWGAGQSGTSKIIFVCHSTDDGG